MLRYYLAGEDEELKHKEKEYRDKLVLKLKKKDDGSKNERKIKKSKNEGKFI